MENQEIMQEEVVEATEGTGVSDKVKKAGLIALIVAGVTVAGGFVYKKVIKPGVEKIKAKKAAKQNANDPDAWKDELHEAVTEDIE